MGALIHYFFLPQVRSVTNEKLGNIADELRIIRVSPFAG